MFVCIPKSGYVGVGEVIGEPVPFADAVLTVDDVPRKMSTLDLVGTYEHNFDAEDSEEYIVPVRWIDARPKSDAVWEKGFFANQNSACKLRSKFTLDELVKRFDLDD
ncbi:MAG: hypothetical protein QOE93_1410 [Actinomycetota bacterium]|nr:hypothetical protein [Actinomycetota bacterium]